MNNRQLGKFKIPEEMIRRTPDTVADAFSIIHAVVVRAEILYAERAVEYIALSDIFTEVPEGEIVPEYILTITHDGSGHVELVEHGLMNKYLGVVA